MLLRPLRLKEPRNEAGNLELSGDEFGCILKGGSAV